MKYIISESQYNRIINHKNLVVNFLFEANESIDSAVADRIKKGINSEWKSINSQWGANTLNSIIESINHAVDISAIINKVKDVSLKEFPKQWPNMKQGIKGGEMGEFIRNTIGRIINDEVKKYFSAHPIEKNAIKVKYALSGGRNGFIKFLIENIKNQKNSKLTDDAIDYIDVILKTLRSLSSGAIYGALYGTNSGNNPIPEMEIYDKSIHKWRDEFDTKFEKGDNEFVDFICNIIANAIWG